MFSSYSDSDHINVGAKQTIIAKTKKEKRTSSIASFPEPRPEVCTAMDDNSDNSGFYWG